QGDAVSIQGSLSDVGTLDTHTVTVDWGDGTSSSATVSESNGTGTLSATHVYATGGIFTITTTLTDDDGGTTTRTTTAVVSGVRLTAAGVLQIIGTAGRDRVNIGIGSSERDTDDDCGLHTDGLLHVSAQFDDGADDGTPDLTFDPSQVKSIL